MSIIVYPDFINAGSSYKLHIMASLTCVEVLKDYVEESRISIKWPNDILVDGCKITGILIKNTFLGRNIRNSIISFGMNVNQTEFDLPRGNCATSVARISGEKVSVETVRYKLWQRFRRLYEMVEKGISLKEWYMLKLHGYDEDFPYFDQKDHQYKTGQIRDVQGSGRLEVESAGELLTYDFKEIKFLFDE